VTSIDDRAVAADDTLVERARSGDADAYASLVLRHQEIAFRVAYLIVGDASEAEDATQEAFVKAFYGLRGFRQGAPFRPWLLEIVANQARNQRRSLARRAAASLRAMVAEGAISPRNGDASPEADVVAREHHREVRLALGKLRHDDRLVIAWRYFLELSEAEMAAALGCPRGTVKSRLSRALERLRSMLEGRDG
jgi:RNA polymerase sigma factor (sigma-70 family)